MNILDRLSYTMYMSIRITAIFMYFAILSISTIGLIANIRTKNTNGIVYSIIGILICITCTVIYLLEISY